MLNPSFAKLTWFFPALVLFSCATPKKAIVVERPHHGSAPIERAGEPKAEKPKLPRLQNDGIRLPDMVTMPGDEEFRRPAGNTPANGSGAIIARPPTEPRQKP